MVKIIKIVVFFGIISLAGYFFFLWYSYIDEIVETGEAYGLSIGSGKEQTLLDLKNSYSGKNLNVLVDIPESCADNFGLVPGDTLMIPYRFTQSGYKVISQTNHWRFYLGAGYNNHLSLEFKDNVLSKIYRHRKYFEIP